MVYIIADIHGRKDRFDDIQKQIKLTHDDTLYILGDVIDRNPDGLTILKYIMSQPNIKMLLGNHEYMMLNALQSEDKIGVWYRNGGNITHQRWKKQRLATRAKILDYLYALPLMTEIMINGRHYKLVHGKNPSKEAMSSLSRGELTRAVVWERVKVEDCGPTDMTVIFGHTSTSHYLDCDPMRIWYGNNLIGMDCGAAYPEGRLACLRLEDMKESHSRV